MIIGLVTTQLANFMGDDPGDSVSERMQRGTLWMYVVLIEHMMLGGMMLLNKIIPPEPAWLGKARLRCEFYVAKLKLEEAGPNGCMANPLAQANLSTWVSAVSATSSTGVPQHDDSPLDGHGSSVEV